MMTELNNVKSIKLSDYSEYQFETSHYGGNYGFWTTYTRIGDNWEISYGTTSDLPFCPCCGSFDCNCGEDAKYEVISTEEMEDIITKFINDHAGDPDYEMYCEKFK